MKAIRSKFIVVLSLTFIVMMLLIPTVALAQDSVQVDPTATEIPKPTATNTPVPPTVVPPTPVAIPEPVTVVLFGTGLAALSAAVATRRRKDN